jgi:hypothetical protein
LKTKEYIQTYKVIKLCCDWISNKGSPYFITFDDIFIAILKADATDGFYGDISCHPAKTKFQSHYNYFNEILKARENGVFHSSQYDESMKQEKEMLENMFRLLANPHSAGKNRKSCIFKEWEILKRQISEYRILTTVGSLPESATKWD